MNIVFHDRGAVANVIITSTVFEFRKHNRVVDTTLFLTPEVTSNNSGFFMMKTVLSGKTQYASRAYRIALREMNR
ncbi:hypothetical protein B7802_07395 [Salmonella enterica]|nr:hypothetical protein [Salmonella enterica]ECW0264943.1 hypothetical protein [Salmonella enterica subsp. diarizonae]EBD5983666.1 hypothetical protein [Salmonella enterica]EBI4324791.1 hypothetical protein [Salmonella enterica]ECO4385956.1 hypothetical protein [Salmonella enterica]